MTFTFRPHGSYVSDDSFSRFPHLRASRPLPLPADESDSGAPTHAPEQCWVVGRETKIMGVLNVTPDSFSDGGDNLCVDDAVKVRC